MYSGDEYYDDDVTSGCEFVDVCEPLRVSAYERAGEPDGCYYCGSQHHSSDCHRDDA